MNNQSAKPNLEDVADFALQILKVAGILDQCAPAPDWDYFAKAQGKIERFDVPWTTMTSLMRRFLYAISAAARPERMVGAGTYVGFAFAWLAMARSQGQNRSRLLEAVGLDVDAEATSLAQRNSTTLEIGARLRFEQAEAAAWLRQSCSSISLLYIDIDAPGRRKSGYVEVLEAARPKLMPGALVIAHDACVPVFASDFERFHDAIKRDSGLLGPEILPLDECGVSICRVV
jgi:predicted O-methyltransferase YrrM